LHRNRYKNPEIPQKTCGNGSFPVDIFSRRVDVDFGAVSPHPHEHWRFERKCTVREMGERPMLTSNSIRKEYTHMAKGMTKTQLIRAMAEKMEVTSKQASSFFTLLADTAVKETKKNGEFTIPGIGKLVKAERKARVGRNPQTGEAIKIKAKTVVKFRVAKVAKDTIAPPKK
jgi:DNA-binding protein HU-beta